jgi:hypothetical protein
MEACHPARMLAPWVKADKATKDPFDASTVQVQPAALILVGRRWRHYKQEEIFQLPLMMRLWTCGQRPFLVHMPTGGGFGCAPWHGPALRYVTECNASRRGIAVPLLRPEVISGMVHTSGWMLPSAT